MGGIVSGDNTRHEVVGSVFIGKSEKLESSNHNGISSHNSRSSESQEQPQPLPTPTIRSPSKSMFPSPWSKMGSLSISRTWGSRSQLSGRADVSLKSLGEDQFVQKLIHGVEEKLCLDDSRRAFVTRQAQLLFQLMHYQLAGFSHQHSILLGMKGMGKSILLQEFISAAKALLSSGGLSDNSVQHNNIGGGGGCIGSHNSSSSHLLQMMMSPHLGTSRLPAASVHFICLDVYYYFTGGGKESDFLPTHIVAQHLGLPKPFGTILDLTNYLFVHKLKIYFAIDRFSLAYQAIPEHGTQFMRELEAMATDTNGVYLCVVTDIASIVTTLVNKQLPSEVFMCYPTYNKLLSYGLERWEHYTLLPFLKVSDFRNLVTTLEETLGIYFHGNSGAGDDIRTISADLAKLFSETCGVPREVGFRLRSYPDAHRGPTSMSELQKYAGQILHANESNLHILQRMADIINKQNLECINNKTGSRKSGIGESVYEFDWTAEISIDEIIGNVGDHQQLSTHSLEELKDMQDKGLIYLSCSPKGDVVVDQQGPFASSFGSLGSNPSTMSTSHLFVDSSAGGLHQDNHHDVEAPLTGRPVLHKPPSKLLFEELEKKVSSSHLHHAPGAEQHRVSAFSNTHLNLSTATSAIGSPAYGTQQQFSLQGQDMLTGRSPTSRSTSQSHVTLTQMLQQQQHKNSKSFTHVGFFSPLLYLHVLADMNATSASAAAAAAAAAAIAASTAAGAGSISRFSRTASNPSPQQLQLQHQVVLNSLLTVEEITALYNPTEKKFYMEISNIAFLKLLLHNNVIWKEMLFPFDHHDKSTEATVNVKPPKELVELDESHNLTSEGVKMLFRYGPHLCYLHNNVMGGQHTSRIPHHHQHHQLIDFDDDHNNHATSLHSTSNGGEEDLAIFILLGNDRLTEPIARTIVTAFDKIAWPCHRFVCTTHDVLSGARDTLSRAKIRVFDVSELHRLGMWPKTVLQLGRQFVPSLFK